MNLVVSISGRRTYNVKNLPSSLDEQPPSVPGCAMSSTPPFPPTWVTSPEKGLN